jgi:hypothetical protein
MSGKAVTRAGAGMRGCLPAFTACIVLFLCGAVIHAVGDGPVTLELPANGFTVTPVYDPETHSYDFHVSRSNTATLRNSGGTDADVKLLFLPAEGLAAAAFFTVDGQTSVGGISLVLPAGQNTEVEINIACLPDTPLDQDGDRFSLGSIKMSAHGGQIDVETEETENPEDPENLNNLEILEESENQESLGSPEATEDPDDREDPERPRNPEEEADSEEPENREKAEDPEEPVNPKASEETEATEDPGNQEDPETTKYQKEPGKQEAPAEPGT